MAYTLHQAHAKKGNPTDPDSTTEGAYTSQALQSKCCHDTTYMEPHEQKAAAVSKGV